MYTISEVSTNVPAFLGKLWKMVEDPVTDDLITWNSSGTAFIIKDETRFARELLPMYYKHNNMASFIRQLNMYGFHKIVSTDANCLKMEVQEEIQFEHPFFIKDHPYLLENIKRKINTCKVVGGEKTPQVITKVLSDMTQMKGRQDNMDGRLMAMKLENEALWRELSLLRQKHIKQQQIVNKLIQFLVTIVQQNQNSFTVKRKFHRMLQHEGKLSSGYVDEEHTPSPGGPVIHELDPAEALLETVVEEAEADTPTDDTTSNFFLEQSLDEEGVVEMPHSNEPFDPEVIIPDVLTKDTFETPEVKFEPKISSTSNSNTQNVRTIYIPRRQQNETVLLKPSFVKLISNNNNENQQPKLKLIIKPKQNTEEASKNLSTGTLHRPDRFGARIHNSKEPKMDETTNYETSVSFGQQERLGASQRVKFVRKQELKPKVDQSYNQSSKSIQQQDRLGVFQRVPTTRKPEEIKLNIGSNEKTNNQPSVVFYKPTVNTQQRQRNQQLKLVEAQQNAVLNKRVKVQNNKQPQVVQVSKNNLQIANNQRNMHQTNNKQQQYQTINLRQTPRAINKPILLQRQPSPKVDPPEIITILPEINEEKLIDVPPVKLDVELDPLVEQPMEGTSTNYSFPIIIDVPAQTEPSPDQQPLVSPQDLLLGSPVVINDPVMTPLCEPVVTPVVTPASTINPSPASTTSVPAADMQVACVDDSQVPSSPNFVTRSGSLLSEMDSHVDNMQADLDNLKELLRSEGISLDANALLGCFNEDPFSYNIPDPIPPEDPNKQKETSGNELMTFGNNPSFYDLSDLIGNDISDWSLPSPGCSEPPVEDSFSEVNTPQFVPQSPSFGPPSKKRKK